MPVVVSPASDSKDVGSNLFKTVMCAIPVLLSGEGKH